MAKPTHKSKRKAVENGATQSTTEIGKLVHDLLCRDAAKLAPKHGRAL